MDDVLLITRRIEDLQKDPSQITNAAIDLLKEDLEKLKGKIKESIYLILSNEINNLNKYIKETTTGTGAPTTGNYCTKMSSIYLNDFPSFSLCYYYFLCPS